MQQEESSKWQKMQYRKQSDQVLVIHETLVGEEKAALRKTIAGSGTDLTCSSILSSLPSKSYSWTGDSILLSCDVLKTFKVNADVILGSYWFHCWCDNKKNRCDDNTKTLIALCQSRQVPCDNYKHGTSQEAAVLTHRVCCLKPDPKNDSGNNCKLDPVGSTVRYEMMKLCTGSVQDTTRRQQLVIDYTGSVEGIYAFIYCTKWRSGQVSPMLD